MTKLTATDYIRAEQIGVKRTALRQRINAYKWDKERAITTPPRKYDRHDDYPVIAKQNGINKKLYYDRTRIGWTKEKASTTPVRDRERKVESPHNSWF